MRHFFWGILFLYCSYRSEIKVIPKTKIENQKIESPREPQIEEFDFSALEENRFLKPSSTEIELKESRETSLQKAQDSRKQKKKKKIIPLHFSGNEFIREVVPHKNLKEGTILTINGNAQLKRLSQSLFADKIEIFGEDAAYVRAVGNLRLLDTKNQLTVRAKVAEYYKWENRLILKGNPQAEWINPNKTKSYLFCQEWERYFDKKISYCRGDVKFQKENLAIYSQIAQLQEEEKTITLWENPHLFQDQHILVAQKIIFVEEHQKEKAFAQGSVKVYHTEVQKDKKILTSIIEAEEATVEKSENLYLGQKITLEGNPVILRRSDFFASAQKAEIFGENGQEIYLWKSVYLKNNKDGSYLVGENFRFFRIIGLAKMESEMVHGKKIRPKGYFFSEKGEEKAIVEAESFERNIFQNRLQARGEVKIHWESAHQSAEIYGEWAEVIEEKEMLTVNGNPSLKQKSGQIFAKQILVFYREKRYELLGPLQGFFNLTQ